MLILRKRNLLLPFFILLSPFFSKAQDATTILLEGKIGKSAIVMELTINGSDIWGQYYYKRFKKNIPLEAKFLDDKTIELVYEHWDSNEKFLLKDIGTETAYIYSGTWQNQNTSSALPVRLKEADLSKISIQNTYVKHAALSEYDYSRLADIKLQQDSVQKINTEFSVVWLSDTISGFSFFRINKNGSVKTDSINALLEAFQFSELLSFLDCGGSEYTSNISSLYIRGHVLSFAVSNSYECGGAHPDYGTGGYTFNLETGKQMKLTDFLFFGKTEADYADGDSYKLGSEVMGPNIVKLLTRLYPDDMIRPADEDEPCDYSTPEVWDHTAWYLTEEGLYLYAYFYRAARCCDGATFSTIPYKTLMKYRNPRAVIPMQY